MIRFTNDNKINLALYINYSAYLVLLAVIIWDCWISDSDHFWLPLTLQTLPLLLLLPGLIALYYRSYSWLCFIILAYFTSYVIQVYSPSRQWQDWIGLAASIAIFIAGMFASRWLQRYFLTQSKEEE